MDFTYLNNTLESWAIAFAVLAGATLGMHALRRLALHKVQALAQRSPTLADDLVATMLCKTYLLIILILSAYLASLVLELSARQHLVISRIAIAALILQLAIWGDTLLRAWRDHSLTGDGRRASRTIVCFLLRLTLWVVAFLMVLDNFGFRVYLNREEEVDDDAWQARARREEAAWRATQRRATQHPLVRRVSNDSFPIEIGS